MKEKIPKTIHYVWVGGASKPDKIVKCINTWKKNCPEYEIKEWNENNFDINSCEFTKKAYELKKWAFVSDYIRMYAIFNEGGIYFDTDVIALSNLDEFLNYDCFVGYESNDIPFTAVFGARKGHKLIKKVLDSYDRIGENYDFNLTNTILVSDILLNDYHCAKGNKKQILADNILVLPKEILCNPSLKSKTIHAFTASWNDNKISFVGKLENKLRGVMYNKFLIFFYRILDFLLFIPKRKIGMLIKKR